MRFGFTVLLLMVAAAKVNGVAAADFYKWTDKDGTVHYTDQPPMGVESILLRLQSAPPVPSSTPTKDKASTSLADREVDFRKRRIDASEAESKQRKAEADLQRKTQACKDARSQLATLQDGGRLTQYNEKNEKVEVDDQTRQQKLSDVQKFISENCS
jgi:hypothetical protein